MDLQTLSQLITTAAVVIGVGFAIIEIRHALRARRDQAAIEVVRGVESAEIRQAVAKILELPVDPEPDVINNDETLLQAAHLVHWASEMYGSMVFERVVDLHVVDRIDGGWLRATWARMRRWIEAERIRSGNPNTGEWMQWLHEMLEADPDRGKVSGAHVFYKGKLRG